MIKIIKLYTGTDNKSYFEEIVVSHSQQQELGFYSDPVAVQDLFFRQTSPHSVYDWHNAPHEQYIIYLEGKVEVTASGGQVRTFQAGDILLAADTHGEGHISKVIEPGKSLIITKHS